MIADFSIIWLCFDFTGLYHFYLFRESFFLCSDDFPWFWILPNFDNCYWSISRIVLLIDFVIIVVHLVT